MYMNTYRISFDTHMGRFHYDVPESEVLSKVNAIMALPGPHNVEVTMKESE